MPTDEAGRGREADNLDDSQIGAVIVSFCRGQMQEAELAQSRAQSPEVRGLANQALADHQTMLAQWREELAADRLAPNDSSVSRQMDLAAQSQLAGLLAVNGKDFDRAYVDDLAKADSRALDLLDRMLVQVRTPRMLTALQGIRTSEESRLHDATLLQQKLLAGP